jgi:hypothetical protein
MYCPSSYATKSEYEETERIACLFSEDQGGGGVPMGKTARIEYKHSECTLSLH